MKATWELNLEKKKINFSPRPTKCNICGSPVKYGPMEEFGVKPYGSMMCYFCPTCKSYVATHKKHSKDALGVLGTKKDRQLRSMCHKLFDACYYSTAGRRKAYTALSDALNIQSEDCHFGYMYGDLLQQAYDILLSWKGKNFD